MKGSDENAVESKNVANAAEEIISQSEYYDEEDE